jgi:hypothetical protein
MLRERSGTAFVPAASLNGDSDILRAELPEAGSPLAFLSIIGFGVLAGGIASAMKTR